MGESDPRDTDDVRREVPEDMVDEAAWIVASAAERACALRIIGGIAFILLTRDRVTLPRLSPADIDLVAPAKTERKVAATLEALGYAGDRGFNARHGDRRLLFKSPIGGRKVEVFVGTFEMCHRLSLTDRLSVQTPTVPRAELLLTKLQIFELNEKDLTDIHLLLLASDVGSSDSGTINANRISELCARDWGLHHTVCRNLERARETPPSYTLTPDQRTTIELRTAELRRAIDDHPKSAAWRLRAAVGERVRWYEEPEEI